LSIYFFFIHSATTVLYTLSLHDALPIYLQCLAIVVCFAGRKPKLNRDPSRSQFTCTVNGCSICSAPTRKRPSGSFSSSPRRPISDRKSTRLNSSHDQISYAVFCLKKKKK